MKKFSVEFEFAITKETWLAHTGRPFTANGYTTHTVVINKGRFDAMPRPEQQQLLVHEFHHAVITQMYEVAP